MHPGEAKLLIAGASCQLTWTKQDHHGHGGVFRSFSDLFFHFLFPAQDWTLFSLSWCYSWFLGTFFWHQNNEQLGHYQCTGSKGPQRLDGTVQVTGSVHDFCLRAVTECVSPEQMCSESSLLLHFSMSQKTSWGMRCIVKISHSETCILAHGQV